VVIGAENAGSLFAREKQNKQNSEENQFPLTFITLT
jgi:hypothetical protein